MTVIEKEKALKKLLGLPSSINPELEAVGRHMEQVHVRDIGWNDDEVGRILGLKYTGDKWSTIKELEFDEMVRSQFYVVKEGVEKYIEDLNVYSPVLPEVAELNGKFYILSGHTRISAQALAGRKKCW